MVHESLRIIHEEHAALAAMLRSTLALVEHGPGENPENFFQVLQAMLFYIDEFPERLHHPKESALLFPPVARLAPHTRFVLERLESDHQRGEAAVRELQHQLTAWELLGELRRAAFERAVKQHIEFYLEHMRLEETVILPEAKKVLSPADWNELDDAFRTNCDPLTGKYPRDPGFDRLFSRIIMNAPAPIGFGEG